MKNGRGRSVGAEGGVRLPYALATIAGTALACSLAAVLALMLVGPRYEARITLTVPSPAGDALVEAAQLPEGGRRPLQSVASFLFARSFAGLRSDITNPIVNAQHRIGTPNSISWMVLPPDAAGVVVVAVAATAEEANDLATASSRSLLDRWEASVNGDRSNGVDTSRIKRTERILAELRSELHALPGSPQQSDLPRALQRTVDERLAAEGELSGIRARVSRLQDVLRAPNGSPDADIDQTFDERLEAYRRLKDALLPLAVLPEDNPRRRTAMARLAQLLGAVRERGEHLLEQWSSDQRATERRLEVLVRTEDQIRTVLGDASRIAAERRTLERAIDRASAELTSLRASASQEEARLPSVRSSMAIRELSRPYIAGAILAAFVGIALATLSVWVLRLVRRRRSRTFSDLSGDVQADEEHSSVHFDRFARRE